MQTPTSDSTATRRTSASGTRHSVLLWFLSCPVEFWRVATDERAITRGGGLSKEGLLLAWSWFWIRQWQCVGQHEWKRRQLKSFRIWFVFTCYKKWTLAESLLQTLITFVISVQYLPQILILLVLSLKGLRSSFLSLQSTNFFCWVHSLSGEGNVTCCYYFIGEIIQMCVFDLLNSVSCCKD